jgi:5-methylcytosine-specific restriction protein B
MKYLGILLFFKILTMYLNENGYIYDKSQEFKTEFFNKVKTCYSNITTEGNPDARTSTGANRVPSLIQLCQFLDYVTVVNFGHNISGLLFNESLFKSDENNTSINKASISSFKGTNILFYGVPGCGKSRLIKTQYCNNEAYMERVVFHPDYTYSDFVGQIMPVLKGTIKSEKNNNIETMKNNNKYMVDDSQKFKAADGHESYVTDDKTKVVYEFVPGPFTRILKKAINDSDNNYFLIIEEITRGNAAAIFGDIFQLLDRQENESEYGITNSDIAREIYGDRKENELIKIPSNLTLLATMNTSDQNVFPLDNAFKRRWELKMVPNTFDVGDKLAKNVIRNTTISWQAFMETINDLIIDNNQSISSLEDKRLGTHFINEDEMNDEELFAEKVLMYLWNDVFKLNRDDIFKTDYKTLESLIDGYKSIHFNIFNNEIMNMIDTRQSQIEETESAKGATVDVEKSSAE